MNTTNNMHASPQQSDQASATSIMIVVVGAHGTGKTTLVQSLISQLAPFTTIPIRTIDSVARRCPFPVGEQSTAQAQRWIFDTQAMEEAEARGIVVLDKCLLTQYAYLEHWSGSDQDRLRLALDSFQKYDLVFMLPTEPELLKPDGLRPTSPEFQQLIHHRLWNLIALSRRSVVLLEDFRKDRAAVVLDCVRTRLLALPRPGR